ncbi:MAG: Fe-S protein assembly co-chaperone HscB [Moraxellaceae bacterium]|nr:MAG: Fe-S protein assembly co-chaperone HscB [Moraxellaceae bacterium]
MDLSKNFFQLFALPESFDIDMSKLMDAYRSLAKVVHPDHFASGTDKEKRLSMEMTAHLNEGVDTLKKPVKRAIYLLGLKGVAVDFEKNTAMSPMFLMEQMELREQLEVVGQQPDPFASIDALYDRIAGMQQERIEHFKRACSTADSTADSTEDSDALNGAADIVAEMQFIEKLRFDVERLEETLD